MSIGYKEPFLDPDGQPHRKRCKRWDDEAAAHYLTFSCFGRQPFLRSQRACRWLLEAIAAAREKHPFELWAFVIMPEHVHMILCSRNGSRISPILKAMKLPVTNRVVCQVRRNCPGFLARMADRQPNGTVAYRFWLRGGGYDRNIRDTRELYEKIRYVHLNPVRRELVAKPEDWVWSSARTYCTGVQEPIALNLDSLPPPPLT